MAKLFLKSEGPNPAIGQDIDERYFEQNGNLYGDYDILKQPRLGGGNYLLADLGRDRGYVENVNDGDIFKSTTIDETMHNMNNGRMPDLKVKGIDIDVKDEYIIRNDNQNTSIKGIVEQSALNISFFSPENMKVIQDTIRYNVYKMTNQVIGYQSENDIYIIMRSILLQYGNFRTNTPLEDIKRLNEMVIEYSVNDISSKVQQQMVYVNDLERLPVPLELPRYENKQNFTYDISNII